jgi:hypothetical protein
MSQALRQILILTRYKKSYDLLKRQKSNVIQFNGGAECRIHFSVIVQRGVSKTFLLRARGANGTWAPLFMSPIAGRRPAQQIQLARQNTPNSRRATNARAVRKVLTNCINTNPAVISYIVMLIAVYLHLGPYSRYIIDSIERRVHRARCRAHGHLAVS